MTTVRQYTRPIQHAAQQGFTLIEVMLVIVLIGVMVSAVQFTFQSNELDKRLETESIRFINAFEIASEYGMLNNIELGLLVQQNSSYQFLAYDGTTWRTLSGNKVFEDYKLPEGLEIYLALDDLPIEEPPLFNQDTFIEEEGILSKEEKKVIPQVFILSGGDITPFSVTFASEESFIEGQQDIAYQITGIESLPLTFEGPITTFNRKTGRDN